jgi:cobalt-zinc-cadmium efflux system protein
VLVSGLVVMATGWIWLDPVVSLGIVVMIVGGTWSLLKESMRMMMAAVPGTVDPHRVEAFLRKQVGVTDVHDLHIWSMSTTETALTAHLVMPGGYPGDAAMDDIARGLREEFSIHHSTLQTEQGTTAHACCLKDARSHEDPDHDHDHDHADHDHGHAHHH